MRNTILVAMIGGWLSGIAAAQGTSIDIPLPAGMPLGFEGPTFASADAVAVATRTTIHVWRRLPHEPEHVDVGLAASWVMVAPWGRLSATTALYVSVGIDLAPQTGDDELMLVTGLPAAPVIVPLGVQGFPLGFTPVNDETAVAIRSDGFHLLHHGSSGRGLEWVPVPLGLAAGGGFGGGASGPDAAMAFGPGVDGSPGTTDDQVVMLSGLASGPGGIRNLSYHDLPPVAAPHGFLVSGSGAGIAWRPLTLPAFEIVVATPRPGGIDFRAMIVVTPAWAIPPFGGSWAYGVEATTGGGVVVWNEDELGPGIGCVLLADLDVDPQIAGAWYVDWNSGMTASVLAERDVAFSHAMGSIGFDYTRYGRDGLRTLHSGEPAGWNDLTFVRPNAGALAAFGHIYHWPARIDATLTLVLDVFGSDSVSTLTTPGCWVGTAAPGWSLIFPRVFSLGAGRVAGFLDSTGSFTGTPPDTLRILTVPTAVIEDRDYAMSFSLLRMAFVPSIPARGSPITVRLEADPAWGSTATLYLAWNRAWRLEAPGVAGWIQLDPASLITEIPVSLAGGTGEITFSTASATPVLEGVPIFVQASIHFGNWVYPSDLGLVVLGGSPAP